jgi:tryptophanyl-tRNA synthetase
VPRGIYPDEGARIKNLQEPERLMSTTRGAPQGVVRLVDSPDEIRKKFKTAVTDSGNEIVHSRSKPGISNLIEIMAVATGDSIKAIEKRYEGSGYGQFKLDVGEAVVELLAPFQARYRELRADDAELRRMLAVGAEKAAAAAQPTLDQMYERMGFVR